MPFSRLGWGQVCLSFSRLVGWLGLYTILWTGWVARSVYHSLDWRVTNHVQYSVESWSGQFYLAFFGLGRGDDHVCLLSWEDGPFRLHSVDRRKGPGHWSVLSTIL